MIDPDLCLDAVWEDDDDDCCPTPQAAAANLCGCWGSGTAGKWGAA